MPLGSNSTHLIAKPLFLCSLRYSDKSLLSDDTEKVPKEICGIFKAGSSITRIDSYIDLSDLRASRSSRSGPRETTKRHSHYPQNHGWQIRSIPLLSVQMAPLSRGFCSVQGRFPRREIRRWMIGSVCVIDLYPVANGFTDIKSSEKGEDKWKTARLFKKKATQNLADART